jgi:integrase
MVYVAVTTGLRVSELIGLRWSDCDCGSGEIRLKRGVVQQETEMTEAGRKPVPLESDLAEVLVNWRAECAYNQLDGYMFASIEKEGSNRSGGTGRWSASSGLLP